MIEVNDKTEVQNDGLNTVTARVLAALLVSISGTTGLVTVFGVQDRYTGTEAAKHNAAFEKDIQYLNREVDEIKIDVEKLQDNNPPREVVSQLIELTKRTRDIERHIDRSQRSD